MSLRAALRLGLAAASAWALIAIAIPAAAPAQSPPAATAKPETKPETKPEIRPAEPTQGPTEGLATKPGDPFGADVTLESNPIAYVKGTATWDKAFAIISGSLKKVETYLDKAGLKANGPPMTIFTATDDNGFDYEAAVPIAELPKNPPHGDVSFGQSPAGHALKFVHRGSYEALDDTYEAITNYLDDKRLESKDVLIEQYVTDPVSADGKNLVINVLVLLK